MKITVIGGGPGGLYFSILTKKAMPHCQIDMQIYFELIHTIACNRMN